MKNTIRKIYSDILSSPNPSESIKHHAFYGLTSDEINKYIKQGFNVYNGKVRHLIVKDDHIEMIHSDRLSAFDKYIGLVPYKGIILAEITEYWLKKSQTVCPTHFISRPNPRTIKIKKAVPFKIEVIVRGYLAGSIMRAYNKGERTICGQRLPEGLKNYEPFPQPIITPTTKAAVFEHDENISPDEIIKLQLCTKEEWEQISFLALKIFELGTRVYQDLGWILVDTKYEFGKDSEGNIILIDEVHTPDSSRFWIAQTYEHNLKNNQAPQMLDKEIIRRYLMEQGFQGEGHIPYVPPEKFIQLGEVYLTVAEKLVGYDLYVEE